MNSFILFFLIFMLYSIFGWLLEVFGKFIEKHKFVDRGFLIGPYCPIYGYGALSMTFLLSKYNDDILVLFVMSMFICSLLEYLTSYFMEKIFNARWWDYSNYKININGRVCLTNTIIFGFLVILVIKVINPFFFAILNKININILYYISYILFIIFVVDNILSLYIINKFRKEIKILSGDSTEFISKMVIKETKKIFHRTKLNNELIYNKSNEFKREITNKLKEHFKNKNFLYKRLIKAYPDFKPTTNDKDLIKNINNKINKK